MGCSCEKQSNDRYKQQNAKRTTIQDPFKQGHNALGPYHDTVDLSILEDMKDIGSVLTINEVAPNSSPQIQSEFVLKKIISSDSILTDYDHREILLMTEKLSSFKPRMKSGFIAAAVCAYENNYNLVIKPDDIWLAILSAFSYYASNAEKPIKNDFVEKTKKFKLKIKDQDLKRNPSQETIINKFITKVNKKVKPIYQNWVISDFSTSSIEDSLISSLSFFSTIKTQSANIYLRSQGLKKVCIMGNFMDWTKIRCRIGKFKKYGLTEWSKLLEYIIDQIIATKMGNGDVNFWNQMCEAKNSNEIKEEVEQQYISGWLLAFAPFDYQGKYNLKDFKDIRSSKTGSYAKYNPEELHLTYVHMPVQIKDSHKKYKTIFYGGQMQNIWDNRNQAIKVSTDYAIIDVTRSIYKYN